MILSGKCLFVPKNVVGDPLMTFNFKEWPFLRKALNRKKILRRVGGLEEGRDS